MSVPQLSRSLVENSSRASYGGRCPIASARTRGTAPRRHAGAEYSESYERNAAPDRVDPGRRSRVTRLEPALLIPAAAKQGELLLLDLALDDDGRLDQDQQDLFVLGEGSVG